MHHLPLQISADQSNHDGVHGQQSNTRDDALYNTSMVHDPALIVCTPAGAKPIFT